MFDYLNFILIFLSMHEKTKGAHTHTHFTPHKLLASYTWTELFCVPAPLNLFFNMLFFALSTMEQSVWL